MASVVPAALLPEVQETYNKAVRHVFIVSVLLSCLAAITTAVVGLSGSWIVEWKPIKKPGADPGP